MMARSDEEKRPTGEVAQTAHASLIKTGHIDLPTGLSNDYLQCLRDNVGQAGLSDHDSSLSSCWVLIE